MADDANPPVSKDDASVSLNEDLARLIAGQPVPVHVVDFKRKDAMVFEPSLRGNTGYIMMVVLFSECNNKVLLIQEAKESCKGTWYLPTGWLRPNETFVEGAKRLVREEAGLMCEAITLLSFQFDSARWMRLGFFAKITGGKLKTLSDKDKESLQADFFDTSSVFNWKVDIRSGDIIGVIHQAMEYQRSMTSVPLHPPVLPAPVGHTHLLHRFILVVQCQQPSRLMMLAACQGGAHMLTCAISPKDSTLLITVHALIRIAIKGETFCPAIHGVVGIEHSGTYQGKDGMCLTTLITLGLPKGQGVPKLQSDNFMWVPITREASIHFIHEATQTHLCKLFEKHF